MANQKIGILTTNLVTAQFGLQQIIKEPTHN